MLVGYFGVIIESATTYFSVKRGIILMGILKKSGAWFFCGGKRKKQNIYFTIFGGI